VATDRLAPIIVDAVDKLMALALSSGRFDRCQAYEPKSNPGTGLTFATWINQIKPIAQASGLDVTSVRVPIMCRIYVDADRDNPETIDTDLAVASSALLTGLTADFGLIGGAFIDLLGSHGDPLGTEFAYLTELDDVVFRITDTLVPIIAFDVWDQEE
jgi:hypothetical protein